MRNVIVAALALASCAKSEPPLPTPGPITGDPITLAYRLRTGESWKFDVEAVQRMGAAGEGGPRATLRYTLALHVLEASPDGGGKIALGFDDLKIESDPPTAMAGGQLDFKGLAVTAVLTRAGAVEDLQVSAPGGRDPELYRTIVKYALMPFRLSERPVRVNEPWATDEVVPTRLIGLPRAVDFRSRTQAWITGIESDGVHIQMTGNVELAKQTVSPEAGSIASGPVEVASAGTLAMRIVFDRGRGMLSELAGDMRSKMDIVTGDDRIVVRTDATTKMRLRRVVAAR